MENIFFERTDSRLSLYEVDYWKRMFLSNLKIGVEIEAEGASNSRAKRERLSRFFEPSNRFGVFGKTGVYKVVSDGSLQDGGIEVCTVGRRVNFIDLYSQYKYITDNILNEGFKVTERCGLHNHILFSYYGGEENELEKPIPDIIMKNYFQLTRRYIPALVWITATAYNQNNLNIVTRYEQFCKTGAILGFTPSTRGFNSYIRKLIENGSGTRYEFCNVLPMVVKQEGTTRMHFEFRFPDGSLYPAQIVAQNILFAAMFIKAIELSQIGLISTGGREYWEETKSLYSSLRQGQGFGSNRFAAPINDDVREKLINRTNFMLDELKHGIYFYEPLAFRILKILATQPITTMRHSNTDAEINKSFNDLINNYYEYDIDDCEGIIKAMQTQEGKGSVSLNQWLYRVSEVTNKSYNETQAKMEKLRKLKEIEFDIQLGVPYFK